MWPKASIVAPEMDEESTEEETLLYMESPLSDYEIFAKKLAKGGSFPVTGEGSLMGEGVEYLADKKKKGSRLKSVNRLFSMPNHRCQTFCPPPGINSTPGSSPGCVSS